MHLDMRLFKPVTLYPSETLDILNQYGGTHNNLLNVVGTNEDYSDDIVTLAYSPEYIDLSSITGYLQRN